jgi:hypothetical protein
MALFAKLQLRQGAASFNQNNIGLHTKSFEQIRMKEINPRHLTKTMTFFSHTRFRCSGDSGLDLEFQNLGYITYVDWVTDSHLDRANVTKETASIFVSG